MPKAVVTSVGVDLNAGPIEDTGSALGEHYKLNDISHDQVDHTLPLLCTR